MNENVIGLCFDVVVLHLFWDKKLFDESSVNFTNDINCKQN